MISLIAAHASNFVIGNNNELPWHIPEDLKHFKALTTGKSVVMGRTTFESIIATLGKPLPNRPNFVVSSTLEPREDATVCTSLEAALQQASASHEEVFVIGGAQIYAYALEHHLVDRMYITRIAQAVAGDALFPQYNPVDWDITESLAGHTNGFDYEFITYDRKKIA